MRGRVRKSWPFVVATCALGLAAPAAQAAVVTVSNNTAMTFPATGNASVYPSDITVAGLSGTIVDVDVTLTGLTHTNSLDLAFAVDPPAGTTADVYDGAGGGHGVSNQTLILDDEAPTYLPQNTALVGGRFKPAVWFLGTNFPAPGPGTSGYCLTGFSTSANCTLGSAWDGQNPNGTWSLYAVDVPNGTPGANTSSGDMDGWSLTITTNLAPVATGDSGTTDEDTPLAVPAPGVLGNDTDADGNLSGAALVTGPAHAASFELNANGSYSYTPAANYNGADAFTYRATDPYGFSNTVTVNLTVTAVNDPPQAAAAPGGMTDEDTPLKVAAPGLLTGAADVDGDPMAAVLDTAPAHGTVDLKPDGSYTYTPAKDYAGPDDFTFVVNDGTADSAAEKVTVDVVAVNDAPVAADGAAGTMLGTVLTVPAPGVLTGAGDVEHDPLTAVLKKAPSHGTVDLKPDGSYAYTPAVGYSGTDAFTFVANDGAVDSAPATISLAVTDLADDVVIDGQETITGVVIGARSVRFVQSIRVPGRLRWRLNLSFYRIKRATTARVRKPIKLASGSQIVTEPGDITVTFKLTRRARRLLKRHPKARLVLRTTLVKQDGRVLKASKTLKRKRR